MAIREIECGQCCRVFRVERGHREKAGAWPRYCPECRVERDRASNRRKQYRWREANPEKWKATQDRANARRLANPDHRRDKREREVARLYGISIEEFRSLLESQGNACAICGFVPPARDESQRLPRGHASGRLHVDHDHKTRRVRGLLCGPCNTALGSFRDDPTILRVAIRYLEKE